MPKLNVKLTERITEFRDAWEKLAPDASFAGMNRGEFVEASEPPMAIRSEIAQEEKYLMGKKAERAIIDAEVADVLEMVVNSVRGTPGYGQNCPLYRAFGYVRKTDRKSGLTRKSKNESNPTVENVKLA
jgi:hypothetical protein